MFRVFRVLVVQGAGCSGFLGCWVFRVLAVQNALCSGCLGCLGVVGVQAAGVFSGFRVLGCSGCWVFRVLGVKGV